MAQMMSNVVILTSVTHLAGPHVPLFFFLHFLHYLWSITEQAHSNLESIY